MSDIFYPSCILLPREAYRYWPTPDVIYRGQGKKSVRFIYENQILTDFEQKKLDKLIKEISKSNLGGMKIPPEWSKNHLLRFCYGGKWKTKNSLKGLISHLQWRQNFIPGGYRVLYPKVLSLLVFIN
jgi:hypothetical protein